MPSLFRARFPRQVFGAVDHHLGYYAISKLSKPYAGYSYTLQNKSRAGKKKKRSFLMNMNQRGFFLKKSQLRKRLAVPRPTGSAESYKVHQGCFDVPQDDLPRKPWCLAQTLWFTDLGSETRSFWNLPPVMYAWSGKQLPRNLCMHLYISHAPIKSTGLWSNIQ
jgi:hypothetical protein